MRSSAPRWAVAWALVAGLAACVSYPKLLHPPIAPPLDAEWVDGGTVRLYSRVDGPTPPSHVVWFVLGPELTQAPLYPALTRALHDAGVATAQVHPRGAGYSDGVRGDTDFAEVVADLERFDAVLAARFPGVPRILFGHSVGGALALQVAARPDAGAAGLVLVNPAYKRQASPGLAPTFGDYLTFMGNMIFRPAALTVDMNSRPELIAHAEDRAEAFAMQADPLTVRYFSMRAMASEGAVMDRCATNAAASRAPLLLLQGEEDGLVDPKGNDELLARSAATEKRRVLVPDAGHGSSTVEAAVQVIVPWVLERR